jgi:hypothetical protein
VLFIAQVVLLLLLLSLLLVIVVSIVDAIARVAGGRFRE